MSSRRRRTTTWLGAALAIACLAIFVRGARWREVGGVLAAADVRLMLAASGFLFTTSLARAWRWRHLLGAPPVSFRHRLTSTLIGFAGNNVLPGRLGEPLRCWAVSRLDGRLGFWQAAGSIVLERVFDLAAAALLALGFLWLVSIGAVGVVPDASLLGRLERDVAGAGLVVIVGVVAVALVLRARAGRADGATWGSRVTAAIASAQRGLRGLSSARAVASAVWFTIVLWSAMLAFDLLMLWAFGFRELGVSHAIGLLVILSFTVAVPQAPAGIGVVQLATEATLTGLFGMPVDRAKAFAIGHWAFQVAIVVGAGSVALWLEGLSLADARRVPTEVPAAPVSQPE